MSSVASFSKGNAAILQYSWSYFSTFVYEILKGSLENSRIFAIQEKSNDMEKIEAYILQFPENVQDILRKIRKLIKDNALNA